MEDRYISIVTYTVIRFKQAPTAYQRMSDIQTHVGELLFLR